MEHTVRDIHDILNSYYKVARKRFIDNICIQETDYHLITGPDIPLRVFSPEFIVELSAKRLTVVAGEDTTFIQQRKSIEKKIESLIKGRRILTAWEAYENPLVKASRIKSWKDISYVTLRSYIFR